MTNSCKKYVVYFGEWKDLVQVKIIPNPDRDPASALKDLAYTFSLAAANADYIEI
jgi:hypothetical protein